MPPVFAFSELLALVYAAFACKKAALAYEPDVTAFPSAVFAAENAELAYSPEVTALPSAVLAARKAELAYEPADTALESAVAAFVVAVLAWLYAELAYDPAVTALESAGSMFGALSKTATTADEYYVREQALKDKTESTKAYLELIRDGAPLIIKQAWTVVGDKKPIMVNFSVDIPE